MNLYWFSSINQGANDEAWGMSDLIIDALTAGSCVEPASFAEDCSLM
jgi:hypothetical protein